MKRLSQFIGGFYRAHPAVSVTLFVLIVITAILIIDFLRNFEPSERINNLTSLQTIIEVLGLLALVFALIEFFEQNKRPQLKLWIEHQANDGESWLSDSEVSNLFSIQRHVTRKGELNQELVLAVLAFYNFRLLLDNAGKKIGRFVKVTISLEGESTKVEARGTRTRLRRDSENKLGLWTLPSGAVGEEGMRHVFSGGENFVVYSHTYEDPSNSYWINEMEQLAEFSLRVPVWLAQQMKFDLNLYCTVQAEQADLTIQKFIIKLPEITDPIN